MTRIGNVNERVWEESCRTHESRAVHKLAFVARELGKAKTEPRHEPRAHVEGLHLLHLGLHFPETVAPDARDLRIHALERDVAALTKLVRELADKEASMKPSREAVEAIMRREFEQHEEIDIYALAARHRLPVLLVKEVADEWAKAGLLSTEV